MWFAEMIWTYVRCDFCRTQVRVERGWDDEQLPEGWKAYPVGGEFHHARSLHLCGPACESAARLYGRPIL